MIIITADGGDISENGGGGADPTESSGYSGSDTTSPRSPRSPESPCSSCSEGAGARMPPWAQEPAPTSRRRLAPPPAPVPPPHTEYFNHKMKPQNGLKARCTRCQ
ncbi:unnamed protein product [Arctia plantaginis]|uniref:Uncharacterized protein n=1 Tax=Arctia plantaginis TaxID=874455 RepID=A0A8S0YNN6_ARCPL|nr:unnamed protein product [Arctia plantaginis]